MIGDAAPRQLHVVPPEPAPSGRRYHVLMSLDAVGGVWRYGMDLASALRPLGFDFTFAGFGPTPSRQQSEEAGRLGELVWFDAPLDWTTDDEEKLDVIPALLSGLVRERNIDLVHLNLPSQADGLKLTQPVLVVSHSCVVTWFAAVRGTEVPQDWLWQKRRNCAGFDIADRILAPSRSHADMLRQCYGPIDKLEVVYNGSRAVPSVTDKTDFVFAAGRWWDDGKNGAVLDAAAPDIEWPVVMAGAQKGPNGQFRTLRNADYRGELLHGEVRALMSRAAIVVSPSLYEPFGLAPLEAAGAQAALVLADIPTYRELWEGAALFADPHDPQTFADAVNQLIADADLRSELARKASARATRYTLAAQAEAMAKVYENLVSHPPVNLSA